ncbi:MAG: DUF5668 domain-containing protein [Acidobacteriota bacterium]
MEGRISPLRILFGGFLVVSGALLLLSRLDLLGFRLDLWHLWPLFLIALGLTSLARLEWISGLVLVGLGGVYLAATVVPDFSVDDVFSFWPLLLVVAGVITVVKSLVPAARAPKKGSGTTAVLQTVEKRCEESAFEGCDLVALAGSCKLDLTGATLHPRGAVIEVFSVWGGVELTVPPDMPVDNRVFSLMGGTEDRAHAGEAEIGSPCLTVRGMVWMAGAEFKNPD